MGEIWVRLQSGGPDHSGVKDFKLYRKHRKFWIRTVLKAVNVFVGANKIVSRTSFRERQNGPLGEGR